MKTIHSICKAVYKTAVGGGGGGGNKKKKAQPSGTELPLDGQWVVPGLPAVEIDAGGSLTLTLDEGRELIASSAAFVYSKGSVVVTTDATTGMTRFRGGSSSGSGAEDAATNPKLVVTLGIVRLRSPRPAASSIMVLDVVPGTTWRLAANAFIACTPDLVVGCPSSSGGGSSGEGNGNVAGGSSSSRDVTVTRPLIPADVQAATPTGRVWLASCGPAERIDLEDGDSLRLGRGVVLAASPGIIYLQPVPRWGGPASEEKN